MKVLYLSYDGMTDPLGQSQVIPYIVGLSGKGYEIYIVSCEKRNIIPSKIDATKELLIKNNIKWFPLSYTSKPPVLSTIIDIRKINCIAKKIIKEQEIQIIHCRGYITAITGMKMQKKFNVNFVFDMRGFFADERAEGGLWNRRNPLYNRVYKYFKRKEKQFLFNADYIISLTENARTFIQNWKLKSQPLSIAVIPCCTDFEMFDFNKINEKEKSNWKEKLGIKETDFILSYQGSIGTWYMLEEMLDFFKVLITKKHNTKFLFITPEEPSVIYDKALQKGILKDKIIVHKAERKDMPVMHSLSNVSIFFILPVFSKSASSPTKMGEIMGMGIPLICNSKIGDVDFIMNNSTVGAVINSFNNEEYLKVVEKIDDICKISPNNIREEAIKYFSLIDGINKYDEVYMALQNKDVR